MSDASQAAVEAAKHDAFVEEVMTMLRARAEDGQIHIADEGVEWFICDALRRMVTLHFPKGANLKNKTSTPLPASKRAALLNALVTMPDEAFGWVVIALATRIWPDGLGGFRDESRTSIVKVKAEAQKLMEQMG